MRAFEGDRLAAAALAVLLATVLAACSPPSEPIETPVVTSQAPLVSSPPATTAASTTPTPAPPISPPSTSHVDFTTQNGSMRLRIPADWTVDDDSGIMRAFNGVPYWRNDITFSSPDGVRLTYFDDHYEIDPGFTGPPESNIVERRALGAGLAAAVWWEQNSDGTLMPSVAVTHASGAPGLLFIPEQAPSIQSLMLDVDEAALSLPDRAALDAFFDSDQVRGALDVLETFALPGQPGVLPSGAAVDWEGRMMKPFITQNGSASFLIPASWSVDDRSTDEGGPGASSWHNNVWLIDDSGYPALVYSDWRGEPDPRQYTDWAIREQEPTMTLWQAATWSYESEAPGIDYQVAVGLVDVIEADDSPTGFVCQGDVCRALIGGTSGGQLSEQEVEEWFSSEQIRASLDVVRSFRAHHDDVTRMPEE